MLSSESSEAGQAVYELVNQHDQAGYKAGRTGYELVNQLVLVACLAAPSCFKA